MKKLSVLFVIVVSVAAIIFGKIHWENKIEAAGKITVTEKSEKQIDSVVEEKEESPEFDLQKQNMMDLTGNLPEEIISKIEDAYDSNDPVHLVIMGSEATPEEDPNAWPSLLKEELINKYGENIFEVTIKEFPNMTSSQFMNNALHQEVIDLQPDMILVENFMLVDNASLVPVQRRFDNLTSMIEDFNSELPGISVILQPANPLYKAVNYPKEVAELEEFAQENDYLYLNHWTAWPDYKSEDFQDYVTAGSPNELGHQTWADYLISYFISE